MRSPVVVAVSKHEFFAVVRQIIFVIKFTCVASEVPWRSKNVMSERAFSTGKPIIEYSVPPEKFLDSLLCLPIHAHPRVSKLTAPVYEQSGQNVGVHLVIFPSLVIYTAVIIVVIVATFLAPILVVKEFILLLNARPSRNDNTTLRET